jgi:dihydrofolate reductase
MRKLILGFYVSLDGKSADADNGIRDVMMSIDDPEQEEYFVSRLWEAGAFLMGRNTYESMAGFWPTSGHPSAKAMNEIPKVVFSRTLKSAEDWPETRIADGDTAEEIAKLKAEPGKDLVAGRHLVPALADQARRGRRVPAVGAPRHHRQGRAAGPRAGRGQEAAPGAEQGLQERDPRADLRTSRPVRPARVGRGAGGVRTHDLTDLTRATDR